MKSTFPHTTFSRTTLMRALLLVLSPATLTAPPLQLFGQLTAYPWLLALALALLLLAAGLWAQLNSLWLRLVASGAFGLWVIGTLLEHPMAPARGLAVLLGVVSVLAVLWPARRIRRLKETRPKEGAFLWHILLASCVAALFGSDEWYTSKSSSYLEPTALTLTYAAPVFLAWRHAVFQSGWLRKALWCAAAFAMLPMLGVLCLFGLGMEVVLTPYGLLSPSLMLGLVSLQMLSRQSRSSTVAEEPGLLDVVLFHPARVLVLSFIAICAFGTLLLGLPMASTGNKSLSWIDAAFTAVSATCVTGLIVVDTPHAFGQMGQFILLCLIQLGGLGIMVFSATAIVLLGERLSLSHERAAVEIVGADGRSGLMRAIRTMLLVTLVTEASAAFLLFWAFLARGESVAAAAWQGIFTSVSAFCNAGFALKSDSLVSYANSPFILGVISLAIILGGLGPAVVAALVSWEDPKRRTLHVRLVLWTTGILLLAPAILIAIIEWNGTLAGMSWLNKLSNAGFQSVTLRTAGFNSIDLAQIQPATWTVMLLVMFVGGSPGSTAGGVKTTTIAVVLLAVFAVIRGRDRVELFGRGLPHAMIMRATAVTCLAVLGCFVALFAIQLTQVIPLNVAIFEVVSALATVGVSTGGTGALDEVGKLIILACMFAGRVGPLTLFVFLSSNTRELVSRRYPDETIPIG